MPLNLFLSKFVPLSRYTGGYPGQSQGNVVAEVSGFTEGYSFPRRLWRSLCRPRPDPISALLCELGEDDQPINQWGGGGAGWQNFTALPR